MENCAPICREFNLNQNSFMWDGESEPFENYVENFKLFLEVFEWDPEEIFDHYEGELSEDDFKSFRENHSVLSDNLELDPLNSKSENAFGL